MTKEILEAALKIDSIKSELERDPDAGLDYREVTTENTTVDDIESAVEYLLDEGLKRLKADARDESKSTVPISEEILKVKKFRRDYLK